jgi:hypothetical protein
MELNKFLYDFGVLLAVLAVYVLAEMLALVLERWAEDLASKRHLKVRH